ncbi:hypothetical protein AB0K18_00735 [Nonomuraea sp. NPDC049421]|uniref:hypothetical protein n=1 Tax=Nonomuraea sp. NPDC049421 TaxID=3155275 RepID=UPI0034145A2A
MSEEKITPADLPSGRSPALDRLDVLVGEWKTAAVFDAGFFGPGSPEVVGHGRTTFAWLKGRRVLAQTFTNDHPDAPDGMCAIGLSDQPEVFVQHYHDSRGETRDYLMTLENGELRFWRADPAFAQRYRGTVTADGKTIEGAWEISEDGHTWRHDFKLIYTRIG